jgi:hypothetical protein
MPPAPIVNVLLVVPLELLLAPVVKPPVLLKVKEFAARLDVKFIVMVALAVLMLKNASSPDPGTAPGLGVAALELVLQLAGVPQL